MAKRNKHFTYKSAKKISAKYTKVLVPLLVKRFNELEWFLNLEDVNYDFYIRCDEEFKLLQKFTEEYNISLADVFVV